MNLREYFESNQRRHLIDKWDHYFDIYEKHFRPFVGKSVKILEIGIYQGGSLQMWKEYFGPGAEIFGVDIDPRCKKFEDGQIRVFIGDQADSKFLRGIVQRTGNFDIIIDDGGHRMNQQITSFQVLYGYLNNGGVYLCEDLHTSYWEQYGGGLKKEGTFIELVKQLIDELHSAHTKELLSSYYFTHHTTGIHIYDSVVVFDKQDRPLPTPQRIGIPTINF